MLFNGISSAELGIQVEHPPAYEYPEKDVDIIHVPGRNGDIIVDKGSFQNVDRTYQLAVGPDEVDYTVLANRLSEWLHSAVGYARLEDTYEPEYFRLALYQEKAKITNILQRAGRVTVTFLCKPQRYLKTGEQSIHFSSRGTLHNPTKFASAPRITVKGTGDGILGIGGYTVGISPIDGEIVLDSEIQDAYRGTVNCNAAITLSDGFPKLQSGENEISFSGGITSVEVIPRWWTL